VQVSASLGEDRHVPEVDVENIVDQCSIFEVCIEQGKPMSSGNTPSLVLPQGLRRPNPVIAVGLQPNRVEVRDGGDGHRHASGHDPVPRFLYELVCQHIQTDIFHLKYFDSLATRSRLEASNELFSLHLLGNTDRKHI